MADESEMSRQSALKAAWLLWLGLVALPLVLLVGALYASTRADVAAAAAANTWFWVLMILLGVGAPAAFFVREGLYARYRRGKLVNPARYLLGMVTVWLPLSLIAATAAVVSIMMRTLLPNIVPAGVALVILLCLWPTGRAMTRRVGGTKDPELYEEPR
jgi:small-conductance mechanosensitive channel